jgi:Tol biopolymer transport system component
MFSPQFSGDGRQLGLLKPVAGVSQLYSVDTDTGVRTAILTRARNRCSPGGR